MSPRPHRAARRPGPAVPRRAGGRGLRDRRRRHPRGRAAARRSSGLCSPNNPTGVPEPDGAIEALLEGLLAPMPPRTGGRRRPCVLDEAYARVHGAVLLVLRAAQSATGRRAHGLEGLRPGRACGSAFGIGARDTLAGDGAVPAARSLGGDPLGRGRDRRPARPRCAWPRTWGGSGASASASPRASPASAWAVGPSATNFLLVDMGSPAQHGRGRPPRTRPRARTFGTDHPLTGHLRFTVRDEVQDDLLLAALAAVLPVAGVARASPRTRRRPSTNAAPSP